LAKWFIRQRLDLEKRHPKISPFQTGPKSPPPLTNLRLLQKIVKDKVHNSLHAVPKPAPPQGGWCPRIKKQWVMKLLEDDFAKTGIGIDNWKEQPMPSLHLVAGYSMESQSGYI